MVRTAAVRRRPWGLAAAVGLLLLVVAAMAGDVPGHNRSGRFLSLDTDAIATWVVPVIHFSYLLLLLVALYRWLNERTGQRRRQRERRAASPLATFLALVIVAGMVVLVLPNLRTTREAVVSTTIGSPRPESVIGDPGEPVSPAATTGGWWLVALLGGGALLYLVAAGRRGRDITIDEEGRSPVPPPIKSKTLEDPLDPGGRVLAAYRRVEEVSERSGLGRSPAETAASHLRRLGSATEPESSVRLAAGFHQARYSGRPVPEETANAAEEDGRRIIRRLSG